MGFGKTSLRSAVVLGFGVQNSRVPVGVPARVSRGLRAFLFRKSYNRTRNWLLSLEHRPAGCGRCGEPHACVLGGGARRRESLLGQDWAGTFFPLPMLQLTVVTAKDAQLFTQLALCTKHP